MKGADDYHNYDNDGVIITIIMMTKIITGAGSSEK